MHHCYYEARLLLQVVLLFLVLTALFSSNYSRSSLIKGHLDFGYGFSISDTMATRNPKMIGEWATPLEWILPVRYPVLPCISPKIAPSPWRSENNVIHGCFRAPDPPPQMASWSSQPFSIINSWSHWSAPVHIVAVLSHAMVTPKTNQPPTWYLDHFIWRLYLPQ